MKTKNKTHGGSRKGAGRKPAPEPVFIKKFRAPEVERAEFMSLLAGDAREDFALVLRSLRLTTRTIDCACSCKREKELLDALALYSEFIKEVAKPPYPDSDLASLLDTLQQRAKAILAG